MTGTVYKRILPSGAISWGYSLFLGRDGRGKQLRKFQGGFKTKREAEEAREEALRELRAGMVVKPSPRTFGDFLTEWFQEHAERNCSPKTVERYRQFADYVLPHLADTRLCDISPLLLERLFNRLRESGGRDRKKKAPRPLSARTVRHIAGLVHVALQSGVRWKLIRSNPMDGVVLPKVVKREGAALDPDGLAWFWDAARSYTGMYEFLMLAAATGARRGELLAITWPDLKLEANPPSLTISKALEQTKNGLRIKTPKNGKTRELSLPRSAAHLLRKLRDQQEQKRRLFGHDYRTDLDLVFCDPQGNYFKPDTVTAKVCLIARKAGLKDVSLHTLRHSHGSQLLSAGVPLPTVSKRLGHSSTYVTAAIYSHALSRDEIAAAEIWDRMIGEQNAKASSAPSN